MQTVVDIISMNTLKQEHGGVGGGAFLRQAVPNITLRHNELSMWRTCSSDRKQRTSLCVQFVNKQQTGCSRPLINNH